VITGRTRLFAVLGDPVAHSLSPAMQNAAFRVLGLDAVYVALPCAASEAVGLLQYLARRGGGGNVTIPHKGVAAGAVERPSDLVRQTGACNTFWAEGDAVHGDNTDVGGVLAALDALEAPPDAWLVAGTGASARAVVVAATLRGAAIAVHSRDPGRAGTFEAWAREQGAPVVDAAECSVVVNATPLGLAGENADPVPPALSPRARVALDLVYRRGETAWVRRARGRGLRAADGREMLVQQGALAFLRWFGGLQPPVDAMRGAVHAELG
jgi:shikimate dehydrogenase